MNIYIVRHGQTDSNLNSEYYGSLDIPLNEQGIKQMLGLKSKLSSIEFDAIYSSSSQRTLRSLEIIVPELQDIVQVDKRLCEINFGDFEGMTYKQICSLYPKEVEKWKRNWKDFCPPNGESFRSLYLRVSLFFEHLIATNEKNVLIMTHSGVIKCMYSYVLGKNMDLYWSFTCKQGKINIIKYEYDNLFIDAINTGEI